MVRAEAPIMIPQGDILRENFSAKVVSLRITSRYFLFKNLLNRFHLLFPTPSMPAKMQIIYFLPETCKTSKVSVVLHPNYHGTTGKNIKDFAAALFQVRHQARNDG
jgi:hypothetical protein